MMMNARPSGGELCPECARLRYVCRSCARELQLLLPWPLHCAFASTDRVAALQVTHSAAEGWTGSHCRALARSMCQPPGACFLLQHAIPQRRHQWRHGTSLLLFLPCAPSIPSHHVLVPFCFILHPIRLDSTRPDPTRSHPIQPRSIPSSPIRSRPVPSHPIQSHPIPCGLNPSPPIPSHSIPLRPHPTRFARVIAS